MARPQPRATGHAPWGAADRATAWLWPRARPLLTPVVTRSPMMATPRTEPTWRVEEMTADATPACAGGMPDPPVLWIGGFTRPRPAPITARAIASLVKDVPGPRSSSSA